MSQPGDKGWKWFPNVKDDWSLDVVTLLAVIGESAMAEHAQSITASLLCLLPRIIPAPQVLLKPSRPSRMPDARARTTGVYNGTTLDSVGFFANIITPLDAEPPFGFKVVEIRHAEPAHLDSPRPPRATARAWLRRVLLPGAASPPRSTSSGSNGASRPPTSAPSAPGDEEKGPPPEPSSPARRSTARFRNGTGATGPDGPGGPEPKPLQRRPTNRQRWQDRLSNPGRTMAVTGERPAVPPRLFSPVHVLSIFSCALSVAIVVAAIVWEDGVAILAVSLISAASSVVGYASFWRPILMQRRHTSKVPPGDVMIRTREGAFVLVRCTEDVTRELYAGTEECRYHVGGRAYRLLMALGTVMLMLSVVLLGNCTWNSQMFIGGSYILLNGLYWGLSMMPRHYSWDLSRYEWDDATPPDAQRAHHVTDPHDQREGHPSFTRTLWYAIRETGRVGWVERSGAAPSTDEWKKWLREAEANADPKRGDRRWRAVERKDTILRDRYGDDDSADLAGQHAPATEVRGAYPGVVPSWGDHGSF